MVTGMINGLHLSKALYNLCLIHKPMAIGCHARYQPARMDNVHQYQTHCSSAITNLAMAGPNLDIRKKKAMIGNGKEPGKGTHL